MPRERSGGEEPMVQKQDSEEKSELEKSRNLDKLAAEIVGKKKKASSPIEKVVDAEGKARKLRSEVREYE